MDIAIASVIIAGASLISAVVATVLARRATRAANATLALTRQEITMSSAEHAEFMRQLQARARFDVTFRALLPADEEGRIVVNASKVYVTVAIGISNHEGDKAAGPTVINVLVPERTEGLRWSGQRGEEIPDTPRRSATMPETVTDTDGNEFTADHLSLELERVTRRTARLVHFSFGMPIPDHGEGSVPIKVLVESDDLPDEEPDVVRELMVRARQRP